MVTKLQKEDTINELKDKLSKATALYTTEQLGLTVSQITDLRTKLRAQNAEYKIAKNTLIGIAAKGTDYEKLAEDLTGPTALLICYEDGTAPAGTVKKFSGEASDKVEFKGAVLEGELLDKEGAIQVAGLPSKEVLLSQIAGMLVGPPSSIAYILQELGDKDEQDKLLKDFMSGASKDGGDDSKEEEKPEEAKTEEPKSESEEG